MMSRGCIPSVLLGFVFLSVGCVGNNARNGVSSESTSSKHIDLPHLLFDAKELPPGVSLGPSEVGCKLPHVDSNPQISSKQEFIRPFIRGMDKAGIQDGDVEEALFAYYLEKAQDNNSGEIAIVGLRFKNAPLAERALEFCKKEMPDMEDTVPQLIQCDRILAILCRGPRVSNQTWKSMKALHIQKMK